MIFKINISFASGERPQLVKDLSPRVNAYQVLPPDTTRRFTFVTRAECVAANGGDGPVNYRCQVPLIPADGGSGGTGGSLVYPSGAA